MIGLLAGGVGSVPGDGLVVEIRRIPAQLGGQFSAQTASYVVYFATCFVYAGSPGVGRGSPQGMRPTSGLRTSRGGQGDTLNLGKVSDLSAVVAPTHVSGPGTEPSSNERDNHEPNVGI